VDNGTQLAAGPADSELQRNRFVAIAHSPVPVSGLRFCILFCVFVFCVCPEDGHAQRGLHMSALTSGQGAHVPPRSVAANLKSVIQTCCLRGPGRPLLIAALRCFAAEIWEPCIPAASAVL